MSVDPIEDHRAWIGDIKDTQGVALNFPLIADPDRKVATAYGMIHPNASDTLTVRSLFVIGPDKKIKLKIEYPASTGRNFDEVLRVIDSLQLTAKHQVATPANWKSGEDVIIVPAVSDDRPAAGGGSGLAAEADPLGLAGRQLGRLRICHADNLVQGGACGRQTGERGFAHVRCKSGVLPESSNRNVLSGLRLHRIVYEE